MRGKRCRAAALNFANVRKLALLRKYAQTNAQILIGAIIRFRHEHWLWVPIEYRLGTKQVLVRYQLEGYRIGTAL